MRAYGESAMKTAGANRDLPPGAEFALTEPKQGSPRMKYGCADKRAMREPAPVGRIRNK